MWTICYGRFNVCLARSIRGKRWRLNCSMYKHILVCTYLDTRKHPSVHTQTNNDIHIHRNTFPVVVWIQHFQICFPSWISRGIIHSYCLRSSCVNSRVSDWILSPDNCSFIDIHVIVSVCVPCVSIFSQTNLLLPPSEVGCTRQNKWHHWEIHLCAVSVPPQEGAVGGFSPSTFHRPKPIHL